ncbi:hypothetical protein OUZ56_003702 [Daphnia magna]|uniref:Uncharacterized protein n=1 Tax=Daphnia magna TaxID=35525 RepID=A0ABR0A9X7_9CRUS|nr:hypothetical protein OUZ56_003702 [Daphnia magna]
MNLCQAREQQKARCDKRVKEQKLNVGDKFLLDMRTPLAGIKAEKFVQETADELETSPPPLETNLQSELDQTPCEKETLTQNLMCPPPKITPTPNLMTGSQTISLTFKPIPEASILPIQPERRFGLRPWNLLKPIVKF